MFTLLRLPEVIVKTFWWKNSDGSKF